MWKITLRFLIQNNNNCREKHDCCISLHKIQTRAMIPNLFHMRTPDNAAFNEKDTSGVSSPKFRGGILDFRRATIFLFWTPLLKAQNG